EQPLHLLDAVRRLLVSEMHHESFKQLPSYCSVWPKLWKTNVSEIHDREIDLRSVYTSRSVTQLKAKGIYFSPSPTYCLKDVEFESFGVFSASLRLPVRFISTKTKVLFSNLIAFEICPNNLTDFAISSYVILIKSLIHGTKDVKELREKRVLISNLGSDAEVLKVFDEIHTYGMENAGIFRDVKEKIEEHYNSKAKTWMAELIHTYFESPWNAIALFAGIFLLVLAYIQTYFTVHP
ncbi:hypothetical protein M569_04954, partial [Genlisea aurea]